MELLLAILLYGGVLGSTCARDFYVVAPSTLRINTDATVAIAIDGDSEAQVDVYIQDFPGRRKNISHVTAEVRPGRPEIFKFRLDAKDFPEGFLTSLGFSNLVSLNAHFLDNHKEIVIPISSQSGYMFIQTDKPIYTPKQRASFRMISLNEDGLPSKEPFQLQIRNPENIIVDEKSFNEKNLKLDKSFPNHVYEFPKYPVLGQWSATVRFGHNLEQNSTVRFELREYVLPTFTVNLKTPNVILPNAERITVEVTASHVYGKKVKGTVSFRLGVKSEHAARPVYFATFSSKELEGGRYTLRTRLDDLKRHKDIGWFPSIDKSRLVVEATVMDFATGKKEGATDSKAIFSNSPYLISFKRCLSDFKPGLISVFEAEITYVDGRSAKDVLTHLTAVADNGQPLHMTVKRARSDENGRVAYEIRPERHHKSVRITLRTNDTAYKEYQAESTFEQHAFVSPSNAYIAISRSSYSRVEVGDYHGRDIHFEPEDLQNIYYLVVARGKIVQIKKRPPGDFKQHRMEIEITHDLVPDFRIVAFAHHGEQLVADSLRVEVKRVCHPSAQVAIDLEFPEQEPGRDGKIIVRGTKGTIVGLLGVDKAVYALSTNDLLTKKKMFNKLSSHDLGCGPGGGVDVNAVLGNAGIALVTNKYTPSPSHSCADVKRRKREAEEEIMSEYSAKDRQCCELGKESDQYGRTCDQRKPALHTLDEIYPNCSEAFLDCCRNGRRTRPTTGVGARGRSSGRPTDKADTDVAEEEEERYEDVRSDFRETWIYKSFNIGPDSREERPLSLPHSITTWVVQAVSMSPQHGICVSENKTLVSSKKLFLHLNLPYSVVRNEQVEIQATVFNYGTDEVKADVEMLGSKDLCTASHGDAKSEKRQVVVGGESAASVAFPVVPLGEGHLDVTVAVYTDRYGTDKIRKQLYVRPEGVTKEIDISIKLDPTNQQKRKKRDIETFQYRDYILTGNEQTTAIKLIIPEKYVPGTESCSITAVGDASGSVVSTAINNPEGLFQRPHGCGEQNMMRLAPTLYTMRYLKVTGRMSAESESKGYEFIRQGYDNQLNYKKSDGSYAAFKNRPTSTWLTAFVMKVFCQATALVHIDENVICSGVQWLIQNQQPNGSYVENYPLYAVDLMGGVEGITPLTAFILIALEECGCDKEVNCGCDKEGLRVAKTRAVAYLETHLDDVTKPLPVAIVAYALALSGSVMRYEAYDKLQALAKYDDDNNWMYWCTENSARDIETAGYGLLTQLLFKDMPKSTAVFNWLITKQLQSGSYQSTQDTVVALQAISEYSIHSQLPSVDLTSNVYLSNDRNFHEVLKFKKENALILQDIKISKVGGTLLVNTSGHGVGHLAVKLRYNVVQTDVCKFDMNVNVTDAKIATRDVGLIDPRLGAPFSEDQIRHTRTQLDRAPALNSRRRKKPRFRRSQTSRVKSQKQDKNRVKLNITLCVRYLGNADAGMSIVDVGIFSGFEPVAEDLQKLENDSTHLIYLFEQSSRGVVFYLEKVPIAENYCFSFHVVQKYIVGKTQMRAIKVYDYYNPDAACTQFYSPQRSSPLLKTICQGYVCQCAEGGCPPERPFEDFASVPFNQKREWMITKLCEQYDYVWKGKLKERLTRRNGLMNILFDVEEVIKEGIETEDEVKGYSRTLMAREDCETTRFLEGATYLVIGKDGQPYQEDDGQIRQRYLLDKTSVVYRWTNISEAQPADQQLIRFLNSMKKNTLQKKCN